MDSRAHAFSPLEAGPLERRMYKCDRISARILTGERGANEIDKWSGNATVYGKGNMVSLPSTPVVPFFSEGRMDLWL